MATEQKAKSQKKKATIDLSVLKEINVSELTEEGQAKLLEAFAKFASSKVKDSQSTVLVRLAREGTELFHDNLGNGFARILLNGGKVADHVEFHKLRSSSFRRWLRQEYLSIKGTVPSATAVSDSLENLEGLAEFQGELIEPRIRIGKFKESVWLDLGRDDWEPVIIGDDEWATLKGTLDPRIRELAGFVKFYRPKGFLPLPVPAPGGDLKKLLSPFLNISSEDDFILIVSWLLGALMPEGPYPILVVHGEQGSAKSTTVRLLKSLIDPTVSDFRGQVREERDLAIGASNNWILAFDNLSWISPWLSDAMCRISSRGGFTTRTLYKDREEEVFSDTRPMVINGISDVVTRHDLLDRCIFVTLPPLSEAARKKEKIIDRDFALAHPKILGCLLTAVSTALKNRSKVDVKNLPRMADFATWVVAAEPALPWSPGAFLDAYRQNRASVHRSAIEADLFASALVEWFRDPAGNDSKDWTGKASELGGLIEDHLCHYEDKKVEALRRRKEWPVDGTRVSKKLRHISGFLRRVGIEVEFEGKRRQVIVRSLPNSVSSVHSVIPEEKQPVGLHAELHAEHAEHADEFLACNEFSSEINGKHAEHAEHAVLQSLFLDENEDEGTPF